MCQERWDFRSFNAFDTKEHLQIYIFTAEGVKSNDTTLPLVELPAVDDSYPPQKKSILLT